MEDGSGLPTWRVKVAAELAGKAFGGVQVDVSPRAAELPAVEIVFALWAETTPDKKS